MSKDVEVVLYSSSPRSFTSARVALALLRRGIANVFVLDGGLNAWKAEGYPVTTALFFDFLENASPSSQNVIRLCV